MADAGDELGVGVFVEFCFVVDFVESFAIGPDAFKRGAELVDGGVVVTDQEGSVGDFFVLSSVVFIELYFDVGELGLLGGGIACGGELGDIIADVFEQECECAA